MVEDLFDTMVAAANAVTLLPSVVDPTSLRLGVRTSILLNRVTCALTRSMYGTIMLIVTKGLEIIIN